MKLIDADNLKVLVAVEQNGNMASGKLVTALFEDIPTVEAIPLKWIENYIWGADTHEEKRALRKMYIQWEKENETDRCR